MLNCTSYFSHICEEGFGCLLPHHVRHICIDSLPYLVFRDQTKCHPFKGLSDAPSQLLASSHCLNALHMMQCRMTPVISLYLVIHSSQSLSLTTVWVKGHPVDQS